MCDNKKCNRCNESKDIQEFYKRKLGGYTAYCKPCQVLQTLERQKEFKRQCIRYSGGKCCMCGYHKSMCALEFHHINPDEKDFNISMMNVTKFNDLVKVELDKCILVCSNCHREEHERINSIKYELNKDLLLSYTKERKPKIETWDNCSCGNGKLLTSSLCKKCNSKRLKLEQRRFNPSKEELQSKLDELKWNICAVGRYYGVSDNAIRSRCKLFGI